MSQLQVTGEAKIRDIQGPVVANSGVITALDGAASQYVRGDGTLADFPTSTGGGSSVSYYLNSSVSQGTIGGVAYRELSKDPIIGAGTDITISANGYVANYITDANDPDVTIVPGGNFNCEFYFSVNNNTGNPTTYAELYKYDGTTFTLLGTSAGVPESINQGTTIAPYYFAIPVATAALSVTDRLAIRIYVSVDGRTVTLHTENSHLCQVVTTFSKGMVSLNNLTDQSQFITTGTSGTDFNIVSTGDTHTFNIPSASASNRGLITTGSQTIAGIKTLSVPSQFEQGLYLKQNMNLFQAGYIGLGASTTGLIVGLSGGGFGTLNFNNTTSFTYTFPNATGTIALTSDLSSYVPYTGATGDVNLGLFSIISNRVSAIGDNSTYGGTLSIKQNNVRSLLGTGYTELFGKTNLLGISFGVGSIANLSNSVLTAERTYTLPDLSGTLALLEGTQTFSGSKTFSANPSINAGGQSSLSILSSTGNSALILGYVNNILKGTIDISATEFKLISAIDNILKFQSSNNFRASLIFSNSADYSYTFPNASGTIALTSNIPANIVTGTGTTNTLPKFTGTSTVGNSNITDTGSLITLGSNVTTTGSQFVQNGFYLTNANAGATAGYTHMWGADDGIFFGLRNATGGAKFVFQSATSYNYTFPAATGTLALTSDLSAYLPLTGGTLTGALTTTDLNVFDTYANDPLIKLASTTSGNVEVQMRTATTTYNAGIGVVTSGYDFSLFTNNIPRLTIASTGAATFSSSVTANTFVELIGDLRFNSTSADRSIYFRGSAGSPDTNWKMGNYLTPTGATVVTAAATVIDVFNGAGYGFMVRNTSNAALLQIAGNTGAATFSSSVTVPSITNGGSFKMDYGSNASSRSWRIISDSYNFGDFSIQQSTTQAGSTYADRLLISASGNVGIGTSSPLQTAANRTVLTINGTSSNVLNFGVGGNLSAYIYSDANDTGLYAQGNLYLQADGAKFTSFVTNATERMRITSNGTIGLNGSADVNNVNDKFSLGYFNSNYGWLQTWSSTALYLNKLGNAVYAGAVRLDTLSDERVKDNIQPIENALSKVLSITGKKFHLKDEDEGKLRYGFIAQELEGVLDEFVIQTDITFKHKELEVKNVKSIENWASSWAALLVEAIKEQQAQIEAQQQQIEELKQLILNK